MSRNPNFDSIVVSGTALESAGHTSFVPTIELPPQATFYWRARVTDKATGVSSLSAMSSFTTAVMNDGHYRYDLWIQMPASCQSMFFETSRFVFDDNLAVSGSSMTFGPAGGYGPFGNAFPGGVTVVLQQTGTTLNGTIVFGGDSAISYLNCAHVSGVRWTLTHHQ